MLDARKLFEGHPLQVVVTLYHELESRAALSLQSFFINHYSYYAQINIQLNQLVIK